MRKNIALIIFLPLAVTVFGQQTATLPLLTKQDYLQKSKKQKTVAWVLLGVGLVSTSLGSIQVNPDYGSNDNQAAFLVVGLAAIGTSIPFFIAASKNKKKAASVSFKMEQSPYLKVARTGHTYYPAVSYSLHIN